MTVGQRIAADTFDSVTEGVSQIQKLAAAAVKLVGIDGVALHLHAAGDDLFQLLFNRGLAQRGEESGIAQETVLDDLGAAVAKDGIGQRGEGIGVAPHQRRLVERAHQIFAHGQVHGGLAAYGGVHRGQKGGGNLDIADAALIGGGGKACQITHHTAAQRRQKVAAG